MCYSSTIVLSIESHPPVPKPSPSPNPYPCLNLTDFTSVFEVMLTLQGVCIVTSKSLLRATTPWAPLRSPKPIPLSKFNGFYQCFWSKLLTSKSLLRNACSIAAYFKKLASKSYFNKMTSTLLQKDWKNSGYFKKLVNLLQILTYFKRIRDPLSTDCTLMLLSLCQW